MTFREELIAAIKRKYEAELELKRIEGEILLQHAIGNANQIEFAESFDSIIERMAYIENKLHTLKYHFK